MKYDVAYTQRKRGAAVKKALILILPESFYAVMGVKKQRLKYVLNILNVLRLFQC